MNAITVPPPRASGKAERNVDLRLAPYTLAVFLGYLAVGVPLAVLPLRVHLGLGFSDVTAGFVVGLQALAAILTRALAGGFCDRRGAKTATMGGAALCAIAGLFYLASSWTGFGPVAALALLCLGRVVLGFGDSLLLTGGLTWAMGAVGMKNSGKVMVWIGIAMYAALAVGAPPALALYRIGGFSAVAIAALAPPLLALAVIAPIPAIAPAGGPRTPFYRVVRLIWRYGAGLCLATLGFSAIAAFIALDYQTKGWGGAGYALTCFGGAYIAARLCFGHLPDRLGGRRIGLASLLVYVAGQLLLWTAGDPAVAAIAAAISGAGFSLVFPALGVEAVKRVPASSRGAGMGAYVAFFDLGFGVGAPIMGAVAAGFGYPAVFVAGALASVIAIPVALRRAADET